MVKRHIFFDLDGTLCQSRQNCTDDMLEALKHLNAYIYIISGADINRMRLQAPIEATFLAQNGNELYIDNKLVWRNQFDDIKPVLSHIELLSKETNTPITNDTFEDRGCQISFSFTGHSAPLAIKNCYDKDRVKRIALLEKFPCVKAVIGGTTCIDYVPFTKGENIKKYIDTYNINPGECLYVGDAFVKYGNDETVVGVVPFKSVDSPEETLNFIKQL